MNFPTSYDNDASTFGDPQEHIVLNLATAIDNDDTLLDFVETSLVDMLEVPSYLTFFKEESDNFEIVKVTAKGGAGTGEVTCTRGALSTTPMAHGTSGDPAVQDPVSEHWAVLRALLLAIQKFQGLVGLKSALPATCTEGECYIATDTQEIFYAIAADTWLLVNRKDHGVYGGLGDDDHTQYQNETRKATWHTALPGDHLTTPTTHNHNGSGTNGPPICRVMTGLLSAKPAATEDGQVYFASDTGDLWFVGDGVWKQYAVIAKGTIILFETDCPFGWTRYDEADDKMPRGAPTGVWSGFTHGGVLTHTHTLPDLITHTHDVAVQNFDCASGGTPHTHSVPYAGGTGWGLVSMGEFPAGPLTTSVSGYHSHGTVTGWVPAQDTDNWGDTSPVSDAGNNLSPYKKMVFCEKE